jgi:hypothetical protein
VIEFRQLRKQGPDGTPERSDLFIVHQQDANEACDALLRSLAGIDPFAQHVVPLPDATLDDRIKDLVLRFEMVVEIASRYADRFGNICKRGGFEAAFIEQPVG